MVNQRAGIAISVSIATLTAASASAEEGVPIVLDDVIVEGERSGRPLNETPASIAVVSGEDADRPSNTNLVDALSGIPNVYYDPANFRLPTIRGIEPTAGAVGGGAITAGAQARVNVIVDGVTRPQLVSGAVTAAFGLWDTEQIEVARGPQSTLGGRNSLAGNVRVETNDPVYFFEGAARALAFDQNGTFGGAGMLNVPLIEDQMAIRLTAEVTEGDSFIDYTNSEIAAIAEDYETNDFERYRGKLLITPEALPKLELSLLAELNKTQAPVDNVVDVGTFINSSAGTDLVLFFDNEQVLVSPELRYAFSGKVDLVARYSFLENDTEVPTTLSDVTGFEFAQDLAEHSAEVLVRGEDIGFLNRFVIGATYDNIDDDIDGAFSGFGAFAANGKIENYAIYAEADLGLTDKLAIILGGRVERQTESRLFQFGPSDGLLDISETVFIPKIGLRYELSENATVGYQYSEGFRAGGIDFDFIDPANGFAEFDSERLRQHEVYARMKLLEERLSLNVSAFFYELDDAQTPGAANGDVGDGFQLRGNIPEVRGFGLEIDGVLDFGDGFAVSGGLGLLDTEITDAGPIVPQFEGDEAPEAPNVTANLGIQYVSDNGFSAFATVRHVGGFVDSLGGPQIPSFTTVDLGAGYEFAYDDVSFRIDAFVNNVADERIVTGSFFGQELVGRPRTFGVSGTIRF